MDDREHTTNHERKYGYRLGRTRDGLTPAGVSETQDCGDQRPGVRDADPENKVNEIEAPKDWAPNPCHTDPTMQLVTPSDETP